MYTFIHSVGYIIYLGTHKIVVSRNIPKTRYRYLINNSPNFLTVNCVTVPKPDEPPVLYGDWGLAENLSKDIIDVSSHKCARLLIVLFRIFMKLHCASCTTDYHTVSDKVSSILVFDMLTTQSCIAYFTVR
jgi:hypothetical protein